MWFCFKVEKNMYSSVEVAWKMLKEAKSKGIPISNLQLQKLIYIAHGYMLGWKNKPLCKEPMEAWEYGPVIGSVYHVFKDNGKSTIPVSTDIATELDGDADCEYIIKGVLEKYGSFSAPILVNLMHQKGTPWNLVWDEEAKHIRSIPIPNDLIQEHFRKVISGAPKVYGL